MTFVTGNRYLNYDEMTINAQYIMTYLLGEGWTKESISGMLGNMQTESTINPGIWENLDSGNLSGGYGLVQWTPASKYLDWATSSMLDPGHIESQIKRILYELENNIQWIPTSTHSMSFYEFTISTESPVYLADVFIKNYERPLDNDQPIRGTQANYWYYTLDGEGSFIVRPTEAPYQIITGRRFIKRRRG